jgi:hypothetical protein
MIEEDVAVADRTGREQRLAFLERGPALVGIVGMDRQPAEQRGADKGHAGPAADRERLSQQLGGASAAPARGLDHGDEPEPLGLEAPRAELARERNGPLGARARFGEVPALGLAHEDDMVRDHLGALVTDSERRADRPSRFVQRALVLACAKRGECGHRQARHLDPAEAVPLA